MTNPLVSIIIPVYNRVDLIGETLDSVLAQTYPNWECIVVDDGSTDKTRITVENYISTDNRLKLFSREVEPKGAATCRNIGLENANGKYILFLDSDDCLGEDCLDNRIINIEKEPEFDFWVYPSFDFNLQPGDTDILWNIAKSQSDLQRFLKMDVPWDITGPIWKVKVLKELNGFNTEAQAWQDWELSVRALLAGYNYKKYNSVDHYIRKSEHRTISEDVGNHKLTKSLIRLVSDLYKKNPQLVAYKAEMKCLLFYLFLIYRDELRIKDLIDTYNIGVFNKKELIYLATYFKKSFKRGKGFIIRKIFKQLGVSTYSQLIDQNTFRSVSYKENQPGLVSV